MEQYISTTEVIAKIFTWHWSMIGWGVALILVVLLLTRFWKYTWELALLFTGLGWLCTMYAGLTGNWYIGWFAWVVPLSATLVIRGLILRVENLPYAPNDAKKERPNES